MGWAHTRAQQLVAQPCVGHVHPLTDAQRLLFVVSIVVMYVL